MILSIDTSIFGTGKFYKEQSIIKKKIFTQDIEEAIDKLLKKINKHIYLIKLLYINNYEYWFWQIAIVVILVVLLFGRGKISSLMGDVAKGIKSFKKGMS